jgi:hypothetical protein
MSTKPVEDLQLRAMEQRNQLHQTVTELKHKVSETKERLDVQRNVREHFVAIATSAALLSLVCGYGVARMFAQQ